MARGSSSSKTNKANAELEPEIAARKRLKKLAFSNNLLSGTQAKPQACLCPSAAVLKHNGKDIVKKSHRKNRFLFSFSGLLAPVSGGKIGELKDLGSKNPILYLEFPQGRMKLFGTIMYPKNRYLTLQFSRGGKNVTCEDYFDNMIVFSDAWWIGTKDENWEEARLDFPKELSMVHSGEYDFNGGAGVVTTIKPGAQKKGINRVEENSLKGEHGDDLVDLEDNMTTPIKTTPVRHSERSAGKVFNFAEASSEEDESAGTCDDLSEGEEKNVVIHEPSIGDHASENTEDISVDSKDVDAVEKSPILQGDQESISKTKRSSRAKGNAQSSNRGILVQPTLHSLFKKVEEKRTPRRSKRSSTSKVFAQKDEGSRKRRVVRVQDDGQSRMLSLFTSEEKSRGRIQNMRLKMTLKSCRALKRTLMKIGQVEVNTFYNW
ncbi:DNA-binding protein RHL1-like isoform X2 [Cucurbita maxima]|uniref:DNA-binding protein RHL1-like isoform X2 n=1 Tax=Cucurbita maxima TaxID=3661 RepID=A0A6J1JYJ5_CUCMA|nr:DNA-binding protein RHL1-like isoform X2 [Cucurbita maxima]